MAQELDGPLNAAALAAFRRSLDGDVIATDDLEYDAARAVGTESSIDARL
jgi:hypothetical protein